MHASNSLTTNRQMQDFWRREGEKKITTKVQTALLRTSIYYKRLKNQTLDYYVIGANLRYRNSLAWLAKLLSHLHPNTDSILHWFPPGGAPTCCFGLSLSSHPRTQLAPGAARVNGSEWISKLRLTSAWIALNTFRGKNNNNIRRKKILYHIIIIIILNCTA